MGHRATILVLALGGAWHATDASAQAPTPAQPRFTVSVTVGGLGLGDLQSQPILVERLDEEGEVAEDATLDRTITMTRGVRANASIAMAMGRSWSVRLGGTVGRAELGHLLTGADAWVIEATGIPMDGDAGVSVTGVESALRFRIPSDRAFRPYLEVGIAAERWRADGDRPFPGAELLAEPLTRVAGHAALGGDYPLTGRLAVRFQASTRFQRTLLAPLPAGWELARTDSLVLTAQPPPARQFADAAIEQVTAVRLALGLSFALGGTAVVRRDRPESDESTSAPPP